jgi:hypothetical protein
MSVQEIKEAVQHLSLKERAEVTRRICRKTVFTGRKEKHNNAQENPQF